MTQGTCKIDGCGKIATASRGWCWTHYGRYRRYGDATETFQQAPCAVDMCAKPSRVRGMCDMHYRRFKKHRDVQVGRTMWAPDCNETACMKPAKQLGKCGPHYYQHWVAEGAGRLRMSAASARRRARESSGLVDRSLSWRVLWQDGERECYLCGASCDPEDYTYRTDRAGHPHKFCGPNHPSLDHVQALSKGGAHLRSNARMACLRCNITKGTRAHGDSKEQRPSQARSQETASTAP